MGSSGRVTTGPGLVTPVGDVVDVVSLVDVLTVPSGPYVKTFSRVVVVTEPSGFWTTTGASGTVRGPVIVGALSGTTSPLFIASVSARPTDELDGHPDCRAMASSSSCSVAGSVEGAVEIIVRVLMTGDRGQLERSPVAILLKAYGTP
jgi:hypothetical protein